MTRVVHRPIRRVQTRQENTPPQVEVHPCSNYGRRGGCSAQKDAKEALTILCEWNQPHGDMTKRGIEILKNIAENGADHCANGVCTARVPRMCNGYIER
jgi:hypothetical protein